MSLREALTRVVLLPAVEIQVVVIRAVEVARRLARVEGPTLEVQLGPELGVELGPELGVEVRP